MGRRSRAARDAVTRFRSARVSLLPTSLPKGLGADGVLWSDCDAPLTLANECDGDGSGCTPLSTSVLLRDRGRGNVLSYGNIYATKSRIVGVFAHGIGA